MTLSTRLALALCCGATLSLAGALCRSQSDESVEWENVGPGGGGWLPCICISRHDNRRLYAGCDVAGCFRSDDGGKTWVNRSEGLPDYYIGEIVEHPLWTNVLFACTHSGVSKSTDCGCSWKAVRAGFPPLSSSSYSSPIACVRFDPKNSDVLYAFRGDSRIQGPVRSQGVRVYKSADGGETFVRVDREGCLPVSSMVVDAAIVGKDAQSLLLTVDKKGVFRSDDDGRTWVASGDGLPHTNVRQLAVASSDPDVVYLALGLTGRKDVCDAGVYKSVDAGRTWHETGPGLPKIPPKDGNHQRGSWPKCLAVHPANPDIVFVGINGWISPGVYRSDDGGGNWRSVTAKNLAKSGWIDFWGPAVEAISIGSRPPYPLAFSTAGYVFRSDDLGEHWSQCYAQMNPDGSSSSSGLETTCLFSVASDAERKDRKYFGYWDVGLMVSDDNGRSFRRSVAGLPSKDANNCRGVVQDKDDPNCLWGAFGQWNENDGVVARSADRGKSWSLPSSASGWVRCSVSDLTLVGGKGTRSALVCCAHRLGIALSTDGGERWSHVATNVFPRVRDVRSVCAADDVVYVAVAPSATLFGEIWKSSDQGVSWTRCSPEGLPFPDLKRIRIKCDEMFAVGREFWSGKDRAPIQGGVWYSRDRGANWRKVYSNRFVTDAIFLRDGSWVVATSDHQYHDGSINEGVLRSCDSGATWVNLSGRTLTNRNVLVLEEDDWRPGVIWAGTQGGGLFRCQVGNGLTSSSGRR